MPLPKPGNVVTTPEGRRAYVLAYSIEIERGRTISGEPLIFRSAHTPELAPITGIHVQYLDDGTLDTFDRGGRKLCAVIDGDGTTLATL